MELGALGSAMSGSGPTVFGIFEKEDLARNAVEVLRKQYAQTFLAKPVKKFGAGE
jgi:4-diphosphocytidyl-2-C-methyl-D-erythritol kinase